MAVKTGNTGWFNRRGQILILVAGGMVGLLALGALAVDVGIWYKDQRAIEHAAELAALSGYKELLKQEGHLTVNSDGGLEPTDPVCVAIKECLQANGVEESEITTISVSKTGLVKISLLRNSPGLFSRGYVKQGNRLKTSPSVPQAQHTVVAGVGAFKANRIAPFAIPEQYNDEDRDQRPNYDPGDSVNQFITSPYVGDTNCSYVLGNPYILLYSVATAETTNDWVLIPMDDGEPTVPITDANYYYNPAPIPIRIPIGTGEINSLSSHLVPYDTSSGGGSIDSRGHLPYGAPDDDPNYPVAALDGYDYYELYQDTVPHWNANDEVDELYTLGIFRAYGVMWDVLGGATDNGQFPYIRWIKGFAGGAFAVERRFLERAGFRLIHNPRVTGINGKDYYSIARTSNMGYPNGKARQASGAGVDTGVKCVLLRFGEYGEDDFYGDPVDRDDGDGDELTYIRWRMRSISLWRSIGSLYKRGGCKIIDFGKTTNSESTRVQPKIATYTGTSDPVTRVLSWAGIPFDAFFMEYNPRIDLDPNSTCVNSYCLRRPVVDGLTYAVDTEDPVSIIHLLRTDLHYHWLHIHHENFAHNIKQNNSAGREARALAQAIRGFVADGGFLFDACLGAETIEAALAYIQDADGDLYKHYGPFANNVGPLGHSEFYVFDVQHTPRLYVPDGSEKTDIVSHLQAPPAGSADTMWGKFCLTDPLNSRSQNHKGFAAGTPKIDYSDPAMPIVDRANDDFLQFYLGSVMTFNETVLKTPHGNPNDIAALVTGDDEYGVSIEYLAQENAGDVYLSLGRFKESRDGSYTNDDALVYFSGTVTKADGSSRGQFAMIGGHIPHHKHETKGYNIYVKENLIEGAWYHRNSTHVPWKLTKTHEGDLKNRGDGLKYDTGQPADEATVLADPETITIAWRGALWYNRYAFYTPDSSVWVAPVAAHWDPEPHWVYDSRWINGAWDSGEPHWVAGHEPGWTDPPGWDTKPWTEDGRWWVDPEWWQNYVYINNASWSGGENGSGCWEPGMAWVGQWWGGVWWGGDSSPGDYNWGTYDNGQWWGDTNWVAEWWTGQWWDDGNWVPAAAGYYTDGGGWLGPSWAFFGIYRDQTYCDDSWCDDYYEVLGNLMFIASGWWTTPWHAQGNTGRAQHWRSDAEIKRVWQSHDYVMRLPITINIDNMGDAVHFRGDILTVPDASDHANYSSRFGTQYYPWLNNRAAGEWGKGWPTMYNVSEDVDNDDAPDLDDDTSFAELFDRDNKSDDPYYYTYGRIRNCQADSFSDMVYQAPTAKPSDAPGGWAPWACYITCDDTPEHVPDFSDSDWDSFQLCWNAWNLSWVHPSASCYREGWKLVRHPYNFNVWSSGITDGYDSDHHNSLFYYDARRFHQGFMNLPRWDQFQCILDEKARQGEIDSFDLRGVFEINGYDMCVLDLDNDGITGDIYEKGAIYRGVPDVAFHRLYLNNILLGALAAEIEDPDVGGMNCGAVNWDFMDSGTFTSASAPFGSNSFVDIMRLGVKGGGLALGDVYKTAPGDLKDAVEEGTDYMFTDTDGTSRASFSWEDYYTMNALPNYYYYAGSNVQKLFDHSTVLDPNTNIINPVLGVFKARPPQIMTIAVVERTDKSDADQTSDKSIYFSDSAGAGDEIQVKVIGFARFFLIDPVVDRLTYEALPDTHRTDLGVRRNDPTPENADQPGDRPTLFLGAEPDLPGELRGHFLGWEIKPPHP